MYAHPTLQIFLLSLLVPWYDRITLNYQEYLKRKNYMESRKKEESNIYQNTKAFSFFSSDKDDKAEVFLPKEKKKKLFNINLNFKRKNEADENYQLLDETSRAQQQTNSR